MTVTRKVAEDGHARSDQSWRPRIQEGTTGSGRRAGITAPRIRWMKRSLRKANLVCVDVKENVVSKRGGPA